MNRARFASLTTIGEKPALRPLPPMQRSSFVPLAVAAARASRISSGRGSRSSAARAPDGATSIEKRMRCVTVAQIVAQLAPSYRHSGRYAATMNELES